MKYPIGIQSFDQIIEGNWVYVDKTDLVYRLVTTTKTCFLSRPRRFGKSLLVSTLDAYFKGRKELFDGLMIAKLEKDWHQYPVFKIDFNGVNFTEKGNLEATIEYYLANWEKIYGETPREVPMGKRFEQILSLAYQQTGRRAVVLVDEYDKPMLQAIGNEELQKEFRNTMKAFYSVLKTMDGCIQFAFLTGVTKFGKVSVFSDLNNLDDISMRNQYIDICGVSEKELHDDLEIELHELADIKGVSYHEICDKLREYYDGYHFTHNSIGIYNPFSLLNTFKYKEFGSYWFETGTPTYLVELLKKHHYDLRRMAHEETSISVLNSIDSASDNPIPVIYQSGYLTIKGYEERFGIYSLGFPNREVEEGFVKFLLPFYANTNAVESEFEIQKFVREVEAGDYDSFFRRLRSFFADTPYELIRDLELHYQNVLFIVFKLVGFYVKAEYHTSEGRIDLVLQTDKFVYVIEFKLDGTAEDALRQINEKHYALPFEAGGNRRLFKIGVNFNAKMRNIEKWIVE